MAKKAKLPYRGESGAWYTQALFWDLAKLVPKDRWTIIPVFTLYEVKDGYICGRTTFVEEGDPTGYKWAMKYLGDWQHWLRLLKCPWFVEAVDHWKAELSIKLESEAIEKIKMIALDDESKSQLPAARFLAELEKKKYGRGRPAKADIEAEIKKEAKARSVEDEDLERIGLRVIPGGK